LKLLGLHVWNDVTPQRGLFLACRDGMSLSALGKNRILVYGGKNCKELAFYDISCLFFIFSCLFNEKVNKNGARTQQKRDFIWMETQN